MKKSILFFFLLFLGTQIKTWAQPADNQQIPSNTDAAKVSLSGLSEDELAQIHKYKKELSQKDKDKKNEGGYVTGLPLFNSDPDTGIGYGVRAYYYYNGKKNDPLFSYTPYRHRIFGQFFQTTNGYQYQWIDYDAPYFLDTLFRLRAGLIYEKNTNANFFGAGSQSLATLKVPAGTTFSKYADYNSELRKIDTAGTTNARYNKYSYEFPNATVTVERDVTYIAGGVIRPILGVVVGKYNINDYSQNVIDVDGKAALQNSTLLNLENSAGQIAGYNGGWDNRIKLGVAFDSRDYEPDPNSGLFTEVMIESSGKGLGANYTYNRYTFSQKVYYSPFPSFADVVLAGRGVYSLQTGNVPFYALNNLSFTEGNKTGLGGLRTLRGFKQDRFTGKVIGLANFEIRWAFFDFTLLGQNFALILAPFVEAGRVWDDPKDTSFMSWKLAYGAGFRIAWNQATIIVFDYGMSSEDSGLFINFNHIF